LKCVDGAQGMINPVYPVTLIAPRLARTSATPTTPERRSVVPSGSTSATRPAAQANIPATVKQSRGRGMTPAPATESASLSRPLNGNDAPRPNQYGGQRSRPASPWSRPRCSALAEYPTPPGSWPTDRRWRRSLPFDHRSPHRVARAAAEYTPGLDDAGVKRRRVRVPFRRLRC
jgi:hypothetical protein